MPDKRMDELWFSYLLWDEEERRGGHMKRPRHEKGVFRVLTVFLDF
jgi:hypothetical protein